ncbi:MAG: enoyl-CoA hydratase/isomerase family protein [Phycisphaerales bacterium]|nr:enoyl-CoA hydratase/isomerase family protein [Planctomycetota bacterium]
MSNTNQLAQLTLDGPVARLALNRPDARNALSLDLLGAMHQEVDRLQSRAPGGPHVLIISGVGKSFCAGMDLKAVLDNNRLALELLTSLAEWTLKIRRLPMVVVASVNGAAIGGGCGLACVCDLAITHADSKMGYPEVDLGVCPAVVAPWLVRKVGAGRARKILLTGGLMSGREAHACGMVDVLCESASQLDETVESVARRLASGGSNALAATKGLLNQLDGSLDDSIVMRGAQLSAQVLATPEAQSRLRAKFSS